MFNEIVFIIIFAFLCLCLCACFTVYEPETNNLPLINNTFDVKNVFDEISNTPYDTQLNNCCHKANLFAQSLKNHGQVDVKLLQVMNKEGTRGHEAVIWNQQIYDLTLKVYGMNYDVYIDMLKCRYGLDGYKYSWEI